MASAHVSRLMVTDLRAMIVAQLPRDLQSKLTISVTTDAYRIGGRAHFKDANGGTWDTHLETIEIEGIPVACGLPQVFIDQLCLVAG